MLGLISSKSTVNPRNGDGFEENGDEDGEASGETVQQIKKVESALFKKSDME